MLRFIILILLLVIINGQQQQQQQQQQPQQYFHPLTNMPPSSEAVTTSYYFHNHPDPQNPKLPIGEYVTILCLFQNHGEEVLNVTAIMGSLNSKYDFHHYYQNYSYSTQLGLVKPDEEATFHYTFQLHSQLEPDEYYIAHTVFYESTTTAGKRPFSSTFFNQTVDLYLPISDYDIKEILKALFYISSVIIISFLAYLGCSPDAAAKFYKMYKDYISKQKKL